MKNKNNRMQLKAIDYVWLIYYVLIYTCSCAIDNSQKVLTMILPVVTFIALCVQGKYVRIKKIERTDCAFWYGWFFIFVSLSYFWSAPGAASVVNTFTALAQALVLLLSIDWYVRTERELNILMHIFCWAAVIFALVVLLTSPPSTYGKLEFGSLTGMQRNTTGYILMFGSLFNVYIGYKDNKKLYYIMSVLCMLVSLLTGSRKIIIGYAIAVCLWVYWQKNMVKALKYFITLICLAIILIPVIYQIPFMQEVFGKRLLAIFDDTIVDGSVLARDNARELAKVLFKNKPITGNGWNAVYINYASYWGNKDRSIYAHNNYLEIAADFGIIGIILFYWKFFACEISAVMKARKDDASKFIAICIAVILILDYGQITYLYIYMISIFAILFKLFYFNEKKNRQK